MVEGRLSWNPEWAGPVGVADKVFVAEGRSFLLEEEDVGSQGHNNKMRTKASLAEHLCKCSPSSWWPGRMF